MQKQKVIWGQVPHRMITYLRSNDDLHDTTSFKGKMIFRDGTHSLAW